MIKEKYVSIIIVLFKLFLLEVLIIDQFPFFVSDLRSKARDSLNPVEVSMFLNISFIYFYLVYISS